MVVVLLRVEVETGLRREDRERRVAGRVTVAFFVSLKTLPVTVPST